jgi:hypothetical protein
MTPLPHLTLRKLMLKRTHWLGLFCLLCAACRSSNDSDQGLYWTRFNLSRLAQSSRQLSWSDVNAIGSIQDLTKLLSENSQQGKGFEDDGWHRPFIVLLIEKEKTKKLRIISCGPNSVYEEGRGDDVFVEITYVENATPTISCSW